jgi:arylsulfatase A-like enzyme
VQASEIERKIIGEKIWMHCHYFKLIQLYSRTMEWLISLGFFSLPSVFVRWIMRKDRSIKGVLQDLFAGVQLGCLARGVPWIIPVFQLLIFYDGWISKKVHFRLEGSCFKFILQLKDFNDSAKDLSIFQLFPLFLMGALPSSFIKPFPLETLILGFPFIYFQINLASDHLLILWEKQLVFACIRLFKKEEGEYSSFVQKEILSSQEVYSLKDPKYPLFRYTSGFKGEKLFDIPLDAKEKPHVMFLNIESFRARDFGAMGSDKGVTPHLDAFAKKSHLFRHFYSNSFPTFRSFYTSLCGIPYVLDMKTLLDINLPTYGISELMQSHGYKTNFFTGADWGIGGLRPFIRQIGVDHIYDKHEILSFAPHAEGASWGFHDEYLLDMTLDHFEKMKETPQFYYILTTTTHHPWIIPNSHTPPPLEHIKDDRYRNYLKTLHYADRQVGRFIKQLEEKKLTKNLILFVMGDHGVGFDGVDPSTTHLGYGRDDFFHVPLMIYAEGKIVHPLTIDTDASHCDLLPTLMDLLGLRGYQHSIGRSLLRKEESPKIFFHNAFKTTGSLFLREKKDYGEYHKTTKEYSGTTPHLRPLLETFEGMLSTLYDKKLTIPKKYQKGGKQLSIEPQMISSQLSRQELEETLFEKSPMSALTLNDNHRLSDDLLTKISKWNPDLDFFHVKGSYALTDESLKRVLRGCKHLYDLNISECLLLTEKCLEYIPESMLKLSLHGLDFVSDKHFKHPFRYLEKLIVTETPLTSQGLRRFPELFPTLTHLHFSYTHMDIDVVQTLLDQMPIKSLSISEGENLSGEDVLKLFKKHPSLESLTFEGCSQISDGVFEAIDETDILEIRLDGVPRLTDRGLEAILNLPIQGLYISRAPNLSINAIKLLDNHRDKFENLSVQVLNIK